MANVPDRSGANLAILPTAAANGSPSFPFHVCHRNGYFALDPAVEYTPDVLRTEIVFSLSREYQDGHGLGWENVIGFTSSMFNLVIGLFWIKFYGTGMANPATAEATYGESKLGPGTYRMILEVPDKDNLHLTLSEADSGHEIGNTTLNVTDMFSGNPIFQFGFPPDDVLAATPDDSDWPLTPCEGLVIESVSRWDTTPFTAITLSNATIPESRTNGNNIIGKLFASHPGQLRGFRFTQEGGIVNPYLQVVGDEIRVAGGMSAGQQAITVRAYDNYNRYADQAFTITVTVG